MSDIRRKPTIPQIIRMARLRKRGLSNAAIALVMCEDYGDGFTGDQVRYFTSRYSTADFPVRPSAHVSCDNRANWVLAQVRPVGEGTQE